MAKLSEKALRKRDAARDIGAELLASVREMKAGQAGHVHRVPVSAITEARTGQASRRNNLPQYSAFQREHFTMGARQTPTIGRSTVSPRDCGTSARSAARDHCSVIGESESDVKFDHEFVGREALTRMAGKPHRRKVTLEWNAKDVLAVYSSLLGDEPNGKYMDMPSAHYATLPFDKILSGGKIIGV